MALVIVLVHPGFDLGRCPQPLSPMPLGWMPDRWGGGYQLKSLHL
ncbi:uncharacterized protein J3R85_007083 [Psidium guajava]|nr:uncharacterized protein J3R85_007083 [Psidium guajava]